MSFSKPVVNIALTPSLSCQDSRSCRCNQTTYCSTQLLNLNMLTFSRSCALLCAMFLSLSLPAQFTGGDGPGQPPATQVAPSTLSSGPVGNSVDLFTGSLSLGYSLGEVATLSGLSYPLRLQYNSASLVSYDAEQTSGIPFGEGWSLADASITVQTGSFEFLPGDIPSDNQQRKVYDRVEAKQRHKLYYTNPRISLPGGISGRLVYKYPDEKTGNAIYVLNGFDTYIEVKFTGRKWEAVLPDGTVYVFSLPQYRQRNPSGTTAFLAENPTASIVPQAEPMRWHLTEIYNPNHANGQKILFEYEGFGKIDLYKELEQGAVKYTMQTEGNAQMSYSVAQMIDTTGFDTIDFPPGHTPNWQLLLQPGGDSVTVISGNPIDVFSNVYTDIFLKSVTASDAQGATLSKVELKYKSYRPENELSTTGLAKGKFLLLSDPQVKRIDSLYSEKVVWMAGQDGLFAQNRFDRMAWPDSTVEFKNGWKRYMHPMAYQNPLSERRPISHGNNPYLFQLGQNLPGLNPSSNAWLWAKSRAFPNDPVGPLSIDFTHSVLESPRVAGDDLKAMPSGDLYAVRSVIKLPNSQILFNADMNFDVRVATGADGSSPLLPGNGWFNKSYGGTDYEMRYAPLNSSSSGYFDTGFTLHSTLDKIVKWNPAYQGTGINVMTHNTFRLPNMPNEFGGFVVQIGPASDNLKYSQPSQDDESYFHRYENHIGTTNNPQDDVELRRGNWFGTGAPLEPLLRTNRFQVEKDTSGTYDKGGSWERFFYWYLDPALSFSAYQMTISGPNQPTAITRERLKNTLTQSNYSLDYGTMGQAHDSIWDTQLHSLEIARIAKNPYLLDSVIFYTQSGSYSNGLVRTATYTFDHEVAQVPVLNNIAPNSPLANWAHDYKLIGGDTLFRNMIRLSDVYRHGVRTGGEVAAITSYTHFQYREDLRSTPTLNEGTLLDSYWNEFGGKTSFTYNFAQADTAVWNEDVRAPNSDQSYDLMGGSNVYQRVIPVQSVTKEDNQGGQVTDYVFQNPVRFGRGTAWDSHFKQGGSPSNLADRVWGFAKAIVYAPNLSPNPNAGRARTEYYYRTSTGTFADTLLYGRLYETRSFGADGGRISATQTDYTASVAYFNGQEYLSPIYSWYGGNVLHADQNDVYDYDPYYLWKSPYRNYMHSWFIRATESRQTDYDPGNGRSITTTTNYTYYDWDQHQQDTDGDYEEMYRTAWSATAWHERENYYSYSDTDFTYCTEPSWQVASSTTTTDQTPGAYTKKNFYYLYDIEPFITGYGTYGDRHQGSMRPFYLARKNGIRNTVYEDRTTTYNGNPDEHPISLATYYQYEVFHGVPGDFSQVIDNSNYGAVCNNNDPGDFLRETQQAVVYCFGLGEAVERQRLVQEIVDDPRYVQTQAGDWYRFSIESYNAMDFATFNALPDFYNQAPGEVCQTGGFVIGPEGKPKYIGTYNVKGNIGFYATNIQAATRNYGKEILVPAVSDESKQRVTPLGMLPHLHDSTVCNKVHGFATVTEANDSITTLGEIGNKTQIQNFINLLDHNFHLRAIYQQADTLFNERATVAAPNHPDWVSPHCLWDTASLDSSYQSTHIQFVWRPTAPLIRTYHVHERNMFGLVVHESDVRSLHTIYEYAKGEFRYEFDSCGQLRSYIYREFMGLPLSVTVTNFQEIEHTTVIDYYRNEALKEVVTPNGERLEYKYDSQGRLQESSVNGIARTQYDFGQWNGQTGLSWEDKINQNKITSMAFREVAPLKQVVNRLWLDPLGRNAQAVTALQLGPLFETKEYDGMVTYDKWDRVQFRERKQVEISEHNLNYEENLPGSLAMGFHYEGSSKSRIVRSSKAGNYLWSNRVAETRYRMVTLAEFQQRSGATQAEVAEILPFNTQPGTLLYEMETTDEDGKQTWAWSDAYGMNIATLAKTDYNNSNGLALSLFVYDAGGNLTEVIHPNKLRTTHLYNVLGWKLITTTPDAGESRYHYNQAGDLKYFQDENLKADSRFRVFDYDDLGRLKQESTAELGKAPLLNGYWDLVPLLYEEHLNLPFYSIHSITDKAGQSFGIDNFTEVMNAAQMHEDFPRIDFARSHEKLIKEVHYDHAVNRNVTGTLPIDTTSLHPNLAPYAQQQEFVLGRMTAEKIYNEDGDLIEQSLFSYDDEGHGIWLAKQFSEVGITPLERGTAHLVRTTDYNLQGQPGRVAIDLNADGSVEVQHGYEYDPFGRLEDVYLNTDGTDYLVARYQYLLGSGAISSLTYFSHSSDCPDPVAVDRIRYHYDHQGRITDLTSQFLDYSLFYDDDSPGNVQHHQNWNGNINGWKARYKLQGQNVPHFNAATTYGFEYDDLNRLRAADASVPENMFPKTGPSYTAGLPFGGGITASNAKLYGDAGYNYDASGNLNGLWRYGYADPGSSLGLHLGTNWSYHYQAGSNRLTQLKTNGIAQTQIGYDSNGNLQEDSRRGLAGFAYNEQNLPTGYRKAGGDSIRYLYGSQDQRIFKAETNGLETSTTFYLRDAGGKALAIWDDRDTSWTFPVYGMNMVAEYRMHTPDSSSQRTAEPNSKPEREIMRKVKNAFLAVLTGVIFHQTSQEGKAKSQLWPAVVTPLVAEAFEAAKNRGDDEVEPKGPRLKFFVQDHLGNTRLTYRARVYEDNTSIFCQAEHELVSVIDYYPYGKVLRSWYLEGPERFMATAHERDGESGLDYRGARYFDSDYGRFLSLDPLAADFAGWSPYNYAFGNPVAFVDPNGRSPWPWDWLFTPVWTVALPTVTITDNAPQKSHWRDLGDKLNNASKHVGAFFAGTANAIGSNNLLGAGRGDADAFGEYASSAGAGQAFGDVLSLIQGAFMFVDGGMKVGGGGAMEVTGVGTIPGAAIQGVGVAEAFQGGAVFVTAWNQLFFSGDESDNLEGNGTEASQESTNSLEPLGRGSTGRTKPKDLNEELAMKEIKSDPTKGKKIPIGLKDSRWQGWTKMSNKTAHGAEIHYVGRWEDGVLKAVDDFKFID